MRRLRSNSGDLSLSQPEVATTCEVSLSLGNRGTSPNLTEKGLIQQSTFKNAPFPNLEWSSPRGVRMPRDLESIQFFTITNHTNLRVPPGERHAVNLAGDRVSNLRQDDAHDLRF